MRLRKIKIAAIAIAAAAGVSGIVAAAVVEESGSAMTPAASSIVTIIPAIIHTQSVMIGGETETVLVDAQGLPLYFYKLDTPNKSIVRGALASFWPSLVSSRPTFTGAPGKLSMTQDASGAKVAYNGHLIYTSGTASSTAPTPASGSSSVYDY
jgi:predicted lipoprotein with Yx(FWY)xxD motif